MNHGNGDVWLTSALSHGASWTTLPEVWAKDNGELMPGDLLDGQVMFRLGPFSITRREVMEVTGTYLTAMHLNRGRLGTPRLDYRLDDRLTLWRAPRQSKRERS